MQLKIRSLLLLSTLVLAKKNINNSHNATYTVLEDSLIRSSVVNRSDTKAPWFFTIQSWFEHDPKKDRLSDKFKKSNNKLRKVDSFCGAVLYKPGVLLTAAHCVIHKPDNDDPKSQWAKFKYADYIHIYKNNHRPVNSYSAQKKDFAGMNMILHPNYHVNDKTSAAGNDVAMIFFNHHGKLNKNDSAIVPSRSKHRYPIEMLKKKGRIPNSNFEGSKSTKRDYDLRAFGYGLIEPPKYNSDYNALPENTRHFNYIDLEIMRDDKCQDLIDNFEVNVSQFCVRPTYNFMKSMDKKFANYPSTRYRIPSFCSGDSGSPIMRLNHNNKKSQMVTREVFGLVSLHVNKDGYKCWTDSVSGIVTDLSFHSEWIVDRYHEFAPGKVKVGGQGYGKFLIQLKKGEIDESEIIQEKIENLHSEKETITKYPLLSDSPLRSDES